MTDKKLKELSRKDLLCMLIEQSKKLQALQEKYDAAQIALQDRAIHQILQFFRATASRIYNILSIMYFTAVAGCHVIKTFLSRLPTYM